MDIGDASDSHTRGLRLQGGVVVYFLMAIVDVTVCANSRIGDHPILLAAPRQALETEAIKQGQGAITHPSND